LLVIFGCLAVKAGEDSGKAELNTKETQPSFKVQVQRNLVLARVVVRDSKGAPQEAAKVTRDLINNDGCQIILETVIPYLGDKADKQINDHVRAVAIAWVIVATSTIATISTRGRMSLWSRMGGMPMSMPSVCTAPGAKQVASKIIRRRMRKLPPG